MLTVGVGAQVDAPLLADLASAGAFQMLTPPAGLSDVALSASCHLKPSLAPILKSPLNAHPRPGPHPDPHGTAFSEHFVVMHALCSRRVRTGRSCQDRRPSVATCTPQQVFLDGVGHASAPPPSAAA